MTKALEVGSEIVAQLMWSDKTVPDLAEAAGCNRATAQRWIDSFHEFGVVRISGKSERRKASRGSLEGGGAPLLYSLQPSPFKLPDEIPAPLKQKRVRTSRSKSVAPDLRISDASAVLSG